MALTEDKARDRSNRLLDANVANRDAKIAMHVRIETAGTATAERSIDRPPCVRGKAFRGTAPMASMRLTIN